MVDSGSSILNAIFDLGSAGFSIGLGPAGIDKTRNFKSGLGSPGKASGLSLPPVSNDVLISRQTGLRSANCLVNADPRTRLSQGSTPRITPFDFNVKSASESSQPAI